MKIKIHSLSSTITNSSTTVFCYASESGTNIIKDIINQVLLDGGSSKTFDDLYDIRIEYDDDLYDCLADDHYEEIKDMTYDESIEWAKEYLKNNPEENLAEYPHSTHYKILVKNGETEKLMNQINNLFSYEGTFQ